VLRDLIIKYNKNIVRGHRPLRPTRSRRRHALRRGLLCPVWSTTPPRCSRRATTTLARLRVRQLLGPGNDSRVVRYGVVPLSTGFFDRPNLLGMVVIVRQGVTDRRSSEVEPLGNRLRVEAAPFDQRVDVAHGDSPAADVGLVVNLRPVTGDDDVYLPRHGVTYCCCGIHSLPVRRQLRVSCVAQNV